jgi:hypothetical protein
MPRAVAVVALILAIAGCGGSHSAAKLARSGTPATAPKAPPPASTTTTTVPPPNPDELDETACRAFVSFDEFLANAGEAGSDAVGEIGGMLQEAQAAVAAGPGQAPRAQLVPDLEALSALAGSAQWTGAPAEVSSPQVTAVATDCKAYPTR